MAGGRIYSDVVTVGAIEIYQVATDPTGVLAARIGSLAIDNAALAIWKSLGGTNWYNAGLSATDVDIILSTQVFGG